MVAKKKAPPSPWSLRQCPFCNSLAKAVRDPMNFYYVACTGKACSVRPATHRFAKPIDAFHAWQGPDTYDYKTKMFTTGDVAKIVGTSVVTAGRWVDNGKLEGFKLPNATRSNSVRSDRRISGEALMAFMIENEIPTRLLTGRTE